MFMLDEAGQGDFFGTNYTAASSQEYQLLKSN